MIIDNITFPRAVRTSYAQFAEDIYLDVYFRNRGFTFKPFYVDVGAHHPVYKSNTYNFYKRGWHGINIDGDPRVNPLFDLYRPNDNMLNILVGQESEKVQFSLYREGAVNSITTGYANSLFATSSAFAKLNAVTVPLTDVLKEYAPVEREFAFISVDCEGYDLGVLKSNNWDIWRPEVTVVKVHELNMLNARDNEVVQYMTSVGYKLRSYMCVTAFFERE